MLKKTPEKRHKIDHECIEKTIRNRVRILGIILAHFWFFLGPRGHRFIQISFWREIESAAAEIFKNFGHFYLQNLNRCSGVFLPLQRLFIPGKYENA